MSCYFSVGLNVISPFGARSNTREKSLGARRAATRHEPFVA
jgi:hypothetical protein